MRLSWIRMLFVINLITFSSFFARYNKRFERIRINYVGSSHQQVALNAHIVQNLLLLLSGKRVQDLLGQEAVFHLRYVIISTVELENDLLIPEFNVLEAHSLKFFLKSFWVLSEIERRALGWILREHAVLGKDLVY